MSTAKFIFYLVYRSFYRGNYKDIAYEAAVGFIFLFGWVTVSAILNIFGLLEVMSIDKSIQGIPGPIFFVIMMILFYFLFSRIFRKKEIASLDFDKRKKKKGYVWLGIVVFLLVIFWVMSAEMKQIVYMYKLKHQ